MFSNDLCKINNEKNGETFTRTYKVLNVADSNDGKHFYITIRQFQCEEIETVKIKKNLDIVPNNNYEFTFQFTNEMVEDNIESIFKNAILLKISYTDKQGVDQIQDSL